MTLASPPPPVPAMPWESTYPSANADPAPAQGSKTLRSVRSVLKPKSSGKENRTVVPKKSKLGLLGGLASNKDEKKAKDLSDVVRRMGISSASVSVNGGGFEIFVDPSYEDEEIGEILVVRKKKSRAGLDGVFGMDAVSKTGKSGTLGEITNGSARMRSESRGSVRGRTESAKYDKQDGGLLKPKEDDKKWWNLSIGRSRKDSKDERKEETLTHILVDSVPMRSQTPDPFKPSSSEKESKAGRGRFNSLDAGMLLGLSSKATKYESMAPPPPMARSTSLPLGHDALLAYSAKASTPTTPTLLVPPTINGGKDNQGSIALRAMRSVRSFARIGAWASGDGANEEVKKDGTVKEKKSKSKSKKDKEAKDKKDSKKEKAKGDEEKEVKTKESAVRLSTSSFEAGALTSSPAPPPRSQSSLGIYGHKSSTRNDATHSILGLGLPSSMRLGGRGRQGSSASSLFNPASDKVEGGKQFGATIIPPAFSTRLSVDSCAPAERRASINSTTSSLRPISVTSSISGASTADSRRVSDIRWDDGVLEREKEKVRRESLESTMRRESMDSRRASGESTRRSSLDPKQKEEARRRTALGDVFPELASAPGRDGRFKYPILTIEEATNDGHSVDDRSLHGYDRGSSGDYDVDTLSTPLKKARQRPRSEQLLGGFGKSRSLGPADVLGMGSSRPGALYEDDDGKPLYFLLLASLTFSLGVLSVLSAATNDLEKLINVLDLQATPCTPDLTPLKPSLSPYSSEPSSVVSNRLLNASLVSMDRVSSIASLRAFAAASASKMPSSFKKESDTRTQSNKTKSNSKSLSKSKQIKALCNASPTAKKSTGRTMTPGPEPEPAPVFQPLQLPRRKNQGARTVRPLAIRKLSKESPIRLKDAFCDDSGDENGQSDLFGTIRASKDNKRSSTSRLAAALRPEEVEHKSPITKEARRMLGRSLGGSDVSAYQVEVDESDPDSDVPEELRVILRKDDRYTVNHDDMTLDVTTDEWSVEVPRSAPALVPDTVITAPSSAPASTTTYPAHQLTSVKHLSASCSSSSSDGHGNDLENTKTSFDFTGEYARLNQSGDRLSFVEQLESAFKTPAKVDLDFNSDMFKIGFGIEDAPPVPDLPKSLRRIVEDESSVEDMPVLAPRSSSTNIRKQPSRLEALKSSNSTLEVNDSNLKSSTRSKSNSISSSRSRASDGELNRSFRFGGFSSSQGSSSSPVEQAEAEGHLDSKIELTLSDIIPSPRHAREISFHSSMLDDYEDSGLKSMLSKEDELPVKELPPLPASIAPQAMNNSDDVFSDSSRETKRISFVPLTRPSSNVSFAGMDSFDEVRRGFEFHDYRPAFYPAEATALPTGPSGGRYSHRKAQDSVWSIASVSSYGHVLRDGAADPFDYGAVSMEGSMEGTDYTDSMSFEMSTNVDDTFSFIKNRPVGYGRRRVDSDASSFYFTHRRRESNWSVSSIPGIPGMPPPPPISMFTRGHHRKTSSVTSASSIALSYAMHGAMGGRAILARHRRETSTDSMMEEDHSMHRRSFARPGLGDKMFETSANYLDAIAGSPSGSIDLNHLNSADQTSNRDSEGSFDYYDSILDNTQQEHAGRLIVSSYEQPSISVVEDSLFDKSGVRSEVSGDCVFGDSNSNADRARRLPNAQFRPLSLISNQSVHDSMHEDDTMISMIGGGHVRRLSVGSQIEASPCVRIEKRRPRQRHRATARMVYQGTQLVRIDANGNEVRDSKAGGKLHNIVEKPSIASTSSMTFGDNRMGNARRGLLERQSLEASCLVAKGEDNSLSCKWYSSIPRAVPVFTRPMPAGRQRSSTQSSCTTSSESSSGIDTPPLSPSDGSMSGGSMSSIDLLDLGSMLVNTTNPVSSLAAARTRAIANGTGHRRRYSHAQRMSISRASHYETIEEESNASSSECDTPNRSLAASVTKKLDSSINEEPTAIYVVDSDSQSIISVDQETSWDDERGIMAMRKFYTLKDEAHVTVEESRRQWEDTPFSVYALQTFDPPRNPDGMKALLEQSVRTYIPLPAELRRMRSRKGSRPSPYPQTRTFKTSTTSINSPPIIAMPSPASFKAKATGAGTPLKQRSINTLGVSPAPALPQFKLGNLKPMSPFTVRVNDSPLKENKKKMSNGSGDGSFVRPRVPSAVRRSALGWTKRSNGPKNSMENKENAGQGLASTPGDNLRINRPRPRGRTPGSQARPIRV
ncbi:hypothetical protein BKA70DRAFT_1115030 [Coprinopsis sp. MPI-PUGE-AT-0042]|nr:hypothetical protein BKA70DRAFT_1115030 [Coprinopsis sp. MPI-PUGE-AT-0042]